jgi:hypothetical protein
MIDSKSITLISVAWGNHVEPTLHALLHCQRVFPHFDKILLFSNFSLTLNLNGSVVEIRNAGVSNLLEYNSFIVESLNNHIESDFVLIAQSDGYIINPSLWKGEFLNYDYIGAPWGCYGVCGNGGFSLRSKRFLEASARLSYNPRHPVYEICPEDVFLCLDAFQRKTLVAQGIRFADMKTALEFSFESPVPEFPDQGIQNAFGFHGKFHLNTR